MRILAILCAMAWLVASCGVQERKTDDDQASLEEEFVSEESEIAFGATSNTKRYLYEYTNGWDRMLSRATKGVGHGYWKTGKRVLVYSNGWQRNGRAKRPLYRCNLNGNHFVTTGGSNCENSGANYEDVLGYVLVGVASNVLTRCRRTVNGRSDHFVVQPLGCPSGSVYEGPLGGVP